MKIFSGFFRHLGELNDIEKFLKNHMCAIFFDDTVTEWIGTYILPLKKKILDVIQTADEQIALNLKLPPPEPEIHTFIGKLRYSKSFSYVAYALKYSNDVGRGLYGTSGEVIYAREFFFFIPFFSRYFILFFFYY